MGRRSQKSRAGQTRDRANRVVKDSDNSTDKSNKLSGIHSGDSDVNDATDDNPPEPESIESENSDVIDDNLSEPENTESKNSDVSDDNLSEPENTESENSDVSNDNPSEPVSDCDAEGVIDNNPPESEITDSEKSDVTADNAETIKSVNLDEDEPRDEPQDDALDGESAYDIAAGYASVEAQQSPQTCCPNCQTVFEVTPELLSSSDTRVRCGECLGIFDALANLRHQDGNEGGGFNSEASDNSMVHSGERDQTSNERNASGESDSRDATSNDTADGDISLDVTYADFSLFSADAALPDIDYLDETQEVPAFDFDDPGEDGELDETYSETLFAHGPEVDARSAINKTDTISPEDDESVASETSDDSKANAVGAGLASTGQNHATRNATLSAIHTDDELDELIDSLQSSESGISVEESRAGSWWLRSALFLLVLSLAAGLYGYRERESLQHNQYLRPALETLCSLTGCTLAEPVDLASLQVLKRSVFSHPKLNNVLVINIGFVNRASFNQRFPVLEVRLTDRNGGLVVKNSFEPSDYLDNWQPGDVLDAGKRLDVSLNVKDPGNKAMSF